MIPNDFLKKKQDIYILVKIVLPTTAVQLVCDADTLLRVPGAMLTHVQYLGKMIQNNSVQCVGVQCRPKLLK